VPCRYSEYVPTPAEIRAELDRYLERIEGFAMLAASAGVDPDEIHRRLEAGIADGRGQWERRQSWDAAA
jgi:hypothetical protein